MAARCFILGVVGIGPCEEHGWHAAAPHLLFSPRAKLAYGRSCSFVVWIGRHMAVLWA
jgi:hypothetical protein